MTAPPLDPYNVLGVSKDADTAEIRSAHRKLVLKCHPDKVQDPQLKAQKQDEFQRVQQAYELLSNDKERSKYDDQIRLAELRKQKANTSAPRASSKYAEFEIRTAEPPRPQMYKSASSSTKTFVYTKSSYDDDAFSSRYEAEPRPPRRSQSSYPEKLSRRQLEREQRERDDAKEKERLRRKKEDDKIRTDQKMEKMKKEALREKKDREKRSDRDKRRQADEKKRATAPYIEEASYEDKPRSDKKKSSSKKYDEKRERERDRVRERSVPRDASPVMAAPPPPPPYPPMPQDRSSKEQWNSQYATSYIHASRSKGGDKVYHVPHVPSPPPVGGPTAAYAVPEDDVRRSSARPRRGSTDTTRSGRERSFKRSTESLEDPNVANPSPAARQTAQFMKSSSAMPSEFGPDSPPRARGLARQNTMPAGSTYPRPSPGVPTRAQTFDGPQMSAPSGRGRSRMHAQVEEETDSEVEIIEPRRTRERERERERDRKPRSRRERERSPEDARAQTTRLVYQIDGNNRSKLDRSYSHRGEPEPVPYGYSGYPGARHVAVERPMTNREGSYRGHFPKVKESPTYGPSHVQYSDYSMHPKYREEPASAY